MRENIRMVFILIIPVAALTIVTSLALHEVEASASFSQITTIVGLQTFDYAI